MSPAPMPHVHAHGHAHPHAFEGSAVRALKIALLSTAALLVLQVIGGVLSRSLALLARRRSRPPGRCTLCRWELRPTRAHGGAPPGLPVCIRFEARPRRSHPGAVKPLVMLAVATVTSGFTASG